MKKKNKTLAVSIVLPLAAGGLAWILTKGGMEKAAILYSPPLSPPAWIFPVAWTVLYFLMGISSYVIFTSDEEKKEQERKKKALNTYGMQLVVNFLWPVFFFSFQWYFFSFLWLVLLWVLTARMILQFGEINPKAALYNVPYLLWLSFAGYLNLGIWLLN